MKHLKYLFLLIFLFSCRVNKLALPDFKTEDGIVYSTDTIYYFDEFGDGDYGDPGVDYFYYEDAAEGSAPVYYEEYVVEESAEYAYEEPREVYYQKEESARSSHKNLLLQNPPSDVKDLSYAPAPAPIDQGSLTYDIPLEMKVGEVYPVRLRISRKVNNQIAVGLTIDTIHYIITTSEVMEVKLFEPNPNNTDKQFNIQQITDAEQYVGETEEWTEWEWAVSPVKSGNGKLKLIINIIKDTSVGVKKKKINVFEKDIEIEASHWYAVKRWWNKHWQWSFGTFIIPIFLFFWKKRKKDEKVNP